MLKETVVSVILAIVACVAAVQGANRVTPWPPASQQPPTINFCQGCRSIVSYVGRFNSTEDRAAYKDLFRNFCELYYPVSTDFQQGACPFFVDGLYKVLDSVDPVHHCDQIGACQADTPSTLDDSSSSTIASLNLKLSQAAGNKPQSLEQGKICSACEQLVRKVQENLEDPKNIDQVRKKFDAFCEYLKVINAEQECRQVVNQNIDSAIDFIRNLSPRKYCQSIQLCQPGCKEQVADIGHKLPTLADFNDFGIETSVEIDGKTVSNLDSFNYRTGPICMFCETFVKEMFKFLKDNRTEANIRVGLNQICKLAYKSGPKFEKCEQMVAGYSRELIQMLVEETDPELICMLLAQCTYQVEPTATLASLTPKKVNPVSVGDLISLLDPSIEVGSMKTCVECKLFIEYLQSTINDPKSKENIRQWLLNNLCDSLGEKELKESCKSMVEAYSDAFFKAISEQLDAQTVCVEMQACRPRPPVISSFKSHDQSPRPAPVFNLAPIDDPKPPAIRPSLTGQLCNQCVDIVTQIDEYLSANSINHDVSVLIDQVCNKLPNDSAKNKCTILVKTFGQDIVQAISTMESPRQLCSKILLC